MNHSETIITLQGGIPVMENDLGVRWCPVKTAAGYGIGHFEFGSTVFGEDRTAFLLESSVNWPYAAPDFEIVENTAEIGVLRFFGISTKLRLDVTVTLKKGSHLVTFDYALEPMLPVYKRLYAPIAFDTTDFDFLKYPFEDTLTQANLRSFEIETDYARVPFIFGKRSGAFLGAGYYLTDDFASGVIGFDKADSEFRISAQFRGMAKENDIQLAAFPSPDNIRFTDLAAGIRRSIRHFRYIVSMGATQYDLFRDFMDECGYDFNVFFHFDADHLEDDWMDIMKNACYFEGKGYSMKISTDTGDMDLVSPHGSYGTIISTTTQIDNACALYSWWMRHPEETWARTRAFEMADFFVSQQLESGLVPAYNADLGSRAQGLAMDSETNPFTGGKIMGVLEEALGDCAMLRFYQMVKENGDDAKEAWFASALKLARWILAQVDENGRIGRNYSADGRFDMYSYAMFNALYPMDTFWKLTGDDAFRDARDRIEARIEADYLATDEFSNLVGDSTSWLGSEGVPDNDSVGLLKLMSYYAGRFEDTGDAKYIGLAKDIFVYLWACCCPIDMPGFKHPTRGLIREQDFYCCFDSLISISGTGGLLSYFSKITGDPAFMRFYAIALQSFLALQEKNDRFHGPHLGLEADIDGLTPRDVVAEGKHFYTTMGFGFGVMTSMSHPLHCRYAGGKNWGAGMDFRVDVDFTALQDIPYVISSTAVIRQITWKPESGVMTVWCYDLKHDSADLEIKWDGGWSMADSMVYYGFEKAPAAALYDEKHDVLRIPVRKVEVPSKMIQLALVK